MNIWWHVRAGGSLMMVIGSLYGNIVLTLMGFMTFVFGIFGGLIALEKRVEILEREKSNEKTEA